MLEAITDLFSTVASGGATGLLGTAISGLLGLFKAKQDLKREIALRRLDIELAQAEGASAERVAALDLEARETEAEFEALTASYREAAQRWSKPGDHWSIVWVDVLRGATRPGLTWLHLGLVAVMFFWMAAVEAMAVHPLQKLIVHAVLYVYVSASVWWFGGRQVEKFLPKAGGR
ncbi:MAG: hypothetical protein OXH64_11050 [Rhodospirillaceae bacterium]|nr:hypothetical protein [Rhodospirillaceae bacterium]